MCGGIAISQTTKKTPLAPAAPRAQGERLLTRPNLQPSLLYNLGRVISYTVIGAVVGAVGSAFSVSIGLRGALLLVAALFMLLMGATLLGLFAPLRRFVPHLPRGFSAGIGRMTAGRGPLVVGLLNGFLPCGPLQTVQLYALSAGSFIMGAASMLAFSLGTVPLLFFLGAANTLLNERFTRIMATVSAALVLTLGFAMLANALGLFGVVIPF
jgi:sulfite exporter TauE/SafE